MNKKNPYNKERKVADKWFNRLHEIPELDMFFEKAKDYFARKYNIDYLSIHAIHRTGSCFVGFYDQNEWHEWLYKYHGGITNKDAVVARVSSVIDKEELYLEYFEMDLKHRELDIRAEIFGERKHGGCTLITSDEVNNITVYDVTFKDDLALGNLEKTVLYELTRDLIKYRNLYSPFVEHAHKYGDFSDTVLLRSSLDTFQKENWSLFHF